MNIKNLPKISLHDHLDGGLRPQTIGIYDLPIIGLAKQHEEVFIPGRSEPILIPHDRGALKLLQRIRDEAHRFANDFNAELRSRKLRESLLDEMPGLGPKRKDALLEHFGSIQKLRKATVEEIAAAAQHQRLVIGQAIARNAAVVRDRRDHRENMARPAYHAGCSRIVCGSACERVR